MVYRYVHRTLCIYEQLRTNTNIGYTAGNCEERLTSFVAVSSSRRPDIRLLDIHGRTRCLYFPSLSLVVEVTHKRYYEVLGAGGREARPSQ